MTDALLVAAFLPSAACFLGASYVASKGKEGWGWLLVIGFLVCPPPGSIEHIAQTIPAKTQVNH